MKKFDYRTYLKNNPLLKEYDGAKTEYTEEEVIYSIGADPDYEGWVDLAFSKGFTYDEESDTWRGPEFSENIGMEDSDEKIAYYAEKLIAKVTDGDEEGVQGLLDYLQDNPEEMPEDWDVDFIDEYYDDILDQAHALDIEKVFKKVDYNLGLGPERHGVDENKFPEDLTLEDTLEAAKKIAYALSAETGQKAEVNMDTIEPASFDIDLNGVQFDGGSYNIYDDGTIKNMAMGGRVYGHIDMDVNQMYDAIKKANDYQGGGFAKEYGDAVKTVYGVDELKSRIKEIIKSSINEDRESEIKNATLKALEDWYDPKKSSPSLFDLQKISHIKMDRVQSAIKNNKTAKDALNAIFKGIDLNEVQTDEYGSHLEPQFKKGDKVTYLGYPAVIKGINKEMTGVYTYDVSYDKGNGSTTASNIYNKGFKDIKKA